jgi:hypothetical protein
MKNEKLYTQFGSIRSSFLATPISKFLTYEAPQPEPDEVFSLDTFQKFRNLITSPKLAHSSRYSNGKLTKIINLVKKVVENSIFASFFQLTSSLDSLARGIKVGFKMKYNYI